MTQKQISHIIVAIIKVQLYVNCLVMTTSTHLVSLNRLSVGCGTTPRRQCWGT